MVTGQEHVLFMTTLDFWCHHDSLEVRQRVSPEVVDPLRLIVSYIESPSYQLSKHITSLTSPLAGRTDSQVRNSKQFVAMMWEIRTKENAMLVSFDASTSFTNVLSVTNSEMTRRCVTKPLYPRQICRVAVDMPGVHLRQLWRSLL